jgi:hypothetical protein
MVEQRNHLQVPPSGKLLISCKRVANILPNQSCSSGSTRQPSPGSATRQVIYQLQEGCQYSSQPAAVVKQGNHLQVPLPGKLLISCKRVANILLKLSCSNGGATQPSPGSATRQVINQLQAGCQYSSQPVLQQ